MVPEESKVNLQSSPDVFLFRVTDELAAPVKFKARPNEICSAFDFNVQVLHKNNEDPTKPYYRYEDNEGITEFTIPYWGTTDSLFYHIHYYPLYYRTGEIRLNEKDGELLVTFSWDVKADTGTVIIHQEQ